MGIVLAFFYVCMVGAMFYCQIVFFRGSGCGTEAFVLYYWLCINVVVFYVFMAYGLNLWGQYLCWAQEEEEKTLNDAVRWA